jgi:hypothetical protein
MVADVVAGRGGGRERERGMTTTTHLTKTTQ